MAPPAPDSLKANPIRIWDAPARLGGGATRDLHVVLVAPQIPPNTGNIARLCASTGAWLHLVRPLAFDLDHRKVRRAGLDYWPNVRLTIHETFDELISRCELDCVTFFTTHASRLYTDVTYTKEAVLIFGQETAGLGSSILERYPDQLARIPIRPNVRSLNLSNSVAVGVFEVIRQHGGFFEAGPSTVMTGATTE